MWAPRIRCPAFGTGGRSSRAHAREFRSSYTVGESTMAQGTVKWFNADRGYGFIAPDDGTPDVFVHHSAIKGGGFRGLQENQRVEFNTSQGAKGPQADEVHAI